MRFGGTEGGHQLSFVRKLFPVDQQTAQGLTGAIGPDIYMAYQSRAGALLIDRDLKALHPICSCCPEAGSGAALEQAVLYVNDAVTSGAVKTHLGAGRDGELRFVPIAVGLGRSKDKRNRDVGPPNAAQGLLHPGALELQLLAVGHMPKLAAAAHPEVGAFRFNPGGGGR